MLLEDIIPHITDWLMVIITFVYVVATILICIFNGRSAKATNIQVSESEASETVVAGSTTPTDPVIEDETEDPERVGLTVNTEQARKDAEEKVTRKNIADELEIDEELLK